MQLASKRDRPVSNRCRLPPGDNGATKRASAFLHWTVPPDTAEGRRLAVLVGCLEGCHRKTGEGLVLKEEGVFQMGAPTVHNVLREYSDPELVRLLRFGVKQDGKTALLMPAGTFYPLSNADLVLNHGGRGVRSPLDRL